MELLSKESWKYSWNFTKSQFPLRISPRLYSCGYLKVTMRHVDRSMVAHRHI